LVTYFNRSPDGTHDITNHLTYKFPPVIPLTKLAKVTLFQLKPVSSVIDSSHLKDIEKINSFL